MDIYNKKNLKNDCIIKTFTPYKCGLAIFHDACDMLTNGNESCL